MENNENLVLDGTENVEGITTEETAEQVTEPEKVYTQEDFDTRLEAAITKKTARLEAKIRKEYDRKYDPLVSVLKAGTGKNSIEEITEGLTQFYSEKGVNIPQQPSFSDKDTEILARAEAEEIIRSGFEEVIEEADRLKELGVKNMTEREKALFVKLTDHIKTTETNRELEKIGVSKDVYGSEEFKSFASKFNSDTPVTEIYQIYNQTKPKKNIKPMGSMKQSASDSGAVKDFYSYEEASKFTKEDFEKNPELYKRVCESMTKWK